MTKCVPLFCLVLHDIAVCLFMFVEMLYDICGLIFCCMICCCLHCLLKVFPNYHSVCHPNNIYAPLSTTCGGSNHESPVFIRFGYPVANSPTHSLKLLDHFLLTVNDRLYRLDQCNFITLQVESVLSYLWETMKQQTHPTT